MCYLIKNWGLILLLCSSMLYAEEVTIFFNDDYRPVSYKNAQGKPVGPAYDLLKYHEGRGNTKFIFELSNWKRAYEMALRGKGGVIGLSKTKKRMALFDYSEPFYLIPIDVIVKKGNEFTFNSTADLKGKVVGVTNDASYGNEFNAAMENKVFEVDINYSIAVRLKKLLYDRIDCIVTGGGENGLLMALKSDPFLYEKRDQFVILKHGLGADPLYLGFHKKMKMQHFLLDFNKSIKEAMDKGVIPKISNR